MTEHIQMLLLLLALMLGALLSVLLTKRRLAKESPGLQRNLKLLRSQLITAGVLIMLLIIFFLPSLPAFQAYLHPTTVKDISTPQGLLGLLQGYSNAITKTVEVVFWSLFLLVWWVLSSIYQFQKGLVEEIEKLKEKDKV